jgi:hypothetical protein
MPLSLLQAAEWNHRLKDGSIINTEIANSTTLRQNQRIAHLLICSVVYYYIYLLQLFYNIINVVSLFLLVLFFSDLLQ